MLVSYTEVAKNLVCGVANCKNIHCSTINGEKDLQISHNKISLTKSMTFRQIKIDKNKKS
jgi:hypothetical protein